MRERLRKLYRGSTQTARSFRFGILIFDIASIVFFVVSSLLPENRWLDAIDIIIALVILLDLAARLWIDEHPHRQLLEATTWADIVVVITLLLPTLIESLLFLRVLRALRLLRSYRVLRDLREEFAFFKRNEELIQSGVNLGVFVFIMTALVFVLQVRSNPQITNYFDALYFTVSALTTTGFGDITLNDTTGRMLSVVIMVFGVALFLRLVQTIFRPTRVIYDCPDCGLNRHDADAIHCKHCGRVLHISNDGSDI